MARGLRKPLRHAYSVVIWLLLVAAAIIWGVYWEERRSTQILKDWAEREGLKVLSSERRYSYADDFKASRSQAVFRVKVQDEKGFTRHGWVKCGGWWAGLLKNRAEAQWD